MDIFSVFTLFGGLAFFLYGMSVMSNGLEKMAGGTLEKTLKKMTANPIVSLMLGAGITIAIQSSSATTVMLVGLVNSGIMHFNQTLGVIFGANIGTTLTAWILSLSGIKSENVWIRMLKPESFSPLVALIGIALIMFSKKDRRKDVGSILIGFAILMYGMTLMSNSVSPLAQNEKFKEILVAFNNPIVGVLVGTVFTGIIQSSAATIGILQALSATGNITYGIAIPIIMGLNIGTCATSLISSIGVSKNAKRVATVHVSIKIIGTLILLPLFWILNSIFKFAFVSLPINHVGIAFCHTVFNLAITVILMPFSKQLVKLSNFIIRDKEKPEKEVFIDERLLDTPAFAVSECEAKVIEMAHIAKKAFLKSTKLIHLVESGGNFDRTLSDEIINNEKLLDKYEDKLGSFLVRVSGKELSERDSHSISKILHTIGDFERIGDHALNLKDTAREISDKQISFSGNAKSELQTLTSALEEIIDLTFTSYEESNIELAVKVEPLEQVVDALAAEIRSNHIDRLQKGECTIELGFVLSDLLTNFERVSDHCSNIAVAVIQTPKNNFNTHKYLRSVKTADNNEFNELFENYSAKYHL